MRVTAALLILALGTTAGPVLAQSADEKLWTCETSLEGQKTEINYVKDEAYRKNVGALESRFARFGKVTCPGYVTLREILRRNEMAEDGRYCLLWDRANDTYVGAQIGPRKSNAVCGKTFCHRVNSVKATALQGGKAVAAAGYEAVSQRPGATLLSATSGQLAGTLEGAGAAAAGLAASPVAAGAVLVGAAATGGALWYCADGSEAASTASEPLPEPEPFVPTAADEPLGMNPPGSDPADDVVWSSPLPDVPTAAPKAAPVVAPAPETKPAE